MENVLDERAKQQFQEDKQSVEQSLAGNAPVDWARFQRLVLHEMTFNRAFTGSRICGFTKKQIREMCENPNRHDRRILTLSNYVYQKSGYYRRLIDYYVHMACCQWTVDTKARTARFIAGKGLDKEKLKRHLFAFSGAVDDLGLETQFNEILRRVYLHDACFGYRIEQKNSSYIHFFDPADCEIDHQVNGMWAFRLHLNSLGGYGPWQRKQLSDYPPEIGELIQKSANNGYVEIPFEKSVCIKYFDTLSYLFPPMFHLISDILDIDDFKELAKAKTEAEAYRLLVMKIPLNKESAIALGDEVVTPFVRMAQGIVPEIIGVVPTPMDVDAIQFKSDQAERDRVEDATAQLYHEAGISPAIAAGGTSGSEVRLSIRADEGEVFRLYRQVERHVNTWLAFKGVSLFGDYHFAFRILDITAFNRDEVIDRELKLAQASVPNKLTLCAASGISPPSLFGNQYVENEVLMLGQDWKPLITSYTQSSSSEEIETEGRPQSDDDEITKAGEQTRADDGNDSDNRA